jgi:hypothetical protein
MTRALERLFDLDGTVYLGDELLSEAKETLGELSPDRPDYVIEHLGDLLPTSGTHRPEAPNSEGRGD